jgi:hypothetical protein
MTPATVLTRVCTGRTRVLRGTRLGGRVGETEPGKGGRRRRAVVELQRAIFTAGRQGRRGNEAGEVPHPKAKLRWRLAATEERRGSDGDGDRGAAAKVAARLGFPRQEAVATGLTDPRARSGGFIGRPRGHGLRTRASCGGGRPCRGRTQRESEPGSSTRLGKTPTGGSRLSAREEGRREGSWAAGPRGDGSASRLGRAVRGKKKGEERLARLGRVEEKERGERERENGPGPKGKRGRKRIAFKCI